MTEWELFVSGYERYAHCIESEGPVPMHAERWKTLERLSCLKTVYTAE